MPRHHIGKSEDLAIDQEAIVDLRQVLAKDVGGRIDEMIDIVERCTLVPSWPSRKMAATTGAGP